MEFQTYYTVENTQFFLKQTAMYFLPTTFVKRFFQQLKIVGHFKPAFGIAGLARGREADDRSARHTVSQQHAGHAIAPLCTTTTTITKTANMQQVKIVSQWYDDTWYNDTFDNERVSVL